MPPRPQDSALPLLWVLHLGRKDSEQEEDGARLLEESACPRRLLFPGYPFRRRGVLLVLALRAPVHIHFADRVDDVWG